MNRRRLPIRSYVLAVLSFFLVAKLGLNGIFLFTERPAFKVPIWESRSALAEDKEKSPPEGEPSTSPPTAPDLGALQKQIASLENHLKGINADIAKYIQTPSDKTTISPATLQKRRIELDKEREELDEEWKRLQALKLEIDEKLSRVTEIQSAIQSRVDEKQAVQKTKIKHLIKIYTTMPPKKAAVLIEKLEMDVIMALFSKMKGDNVGQILPYVSPEKAAQISEQLAKVEF